MTNKLINKPTHLRSKKIPKKSTLRHIIINIWKTKKKWTIKQQERMMHYLNGDTNLKDSGFRIWNHGSQMQVAEHFSSAKTIYLSTSNSVSAKNISQKWKGNTDILRLRENKAVLLTNLSIKKMVNRSSLKWNKWQWRKAVTYKMVRIATEWVKLEVNVTDYPSTNEF